MFPTTVPWPTCSCSPPHSSASSPRRMDFSEPPDAAAIREAVRALCADFPGEYWRALEPDRYPAEFVAALTVQGWLAALIPEHYGGSGLPLANRRALFDEI